MQVNIIGQFRLRVTSFLLNSFVGDVYAGVHKEWFIDGQ